MGVKELNNYFNKPCRFRLKSGKEVFGVIWPEAGGSNHFFASSQDYYEYVKNKQGTANIIKYPVNLEEVIDAEYLEAV